jgi:transcriptional regulator
VYRPSHFEERDPAVLHALIRAHPLGAWVTTVDGALVVNHIPFLLRPDPGPCGTLVGHVARANDVWSRFAAAPESIVVFQGPGGYVTPSWYPAKREHGKVVPTWNYAVVHAHGTPRAIEDKDWLLALVTALTDMQESRESPPWRVTDAPEGYVRAMLGAIVGIEIPLRALVGKWKVSQNRSAADRAGVASGLAARGDDVLADLVRRPPEPAP